MEESQRQALIDEVTKLRKERGTLEDQATKLLARKRELANLSETLQSAIANHAYRELQCLNSERAYLTQKSLREEEEIKEGYEKRLEEVLKEKEELERRIEAESEFVSRNIRERLAAMHAKTHQLREELYTRSVQVSKDYSKLSSNEALQLIIQANQDHCREVARKIAEAHRELEGLTLKNNRLQTIVEKLSLQTAGTHFQALQSIDSRPRRVSNL